MKANVVADQAKGRLMLRFMILGRVRGEADERPLKLPRGKARMALATLVVNAGRIVPTERLIEAMWGSDPIMTAREQVHIRISRLRRSLVPHQGLLNYTDGGYVLDLEKDAVDANRFERLLKRADMAQQAGDQIEAIHLYREAEGLWHGPTALEDVDSACLTSEATRLNDLRRISIMNRLDAELSLGRHNQVLAELRQRLNDSPLDERLRSQLMLALYRSGRQDFALDVYHEGKSLLEEELGQPPGPGLRRLHQKIITQHVELDPGNAAQSGATR
ncbi:BTAD domain-containing putative transcriptional regulator [Nonomuraea sp. NPDC050451]|uniref:AfsR/SARP family transcriptional regulator n=1 Tax=Nonomuraea sp. NPDC050451 TaxID=3364364 RepID=UPI003793EAC2